MQTRVNAANISMAAAGLLLGLFVLGPSCLKTTAPTAAPNSPRATAPCGQGCQPPCETAAVTMCGVVQDSAGATQRVFCPSGNLGRSCTNSSYTCNDADSDWTHHPPGTAPASPERDPWYQSALYWAKSHGYPIVTLDAGTITITNNAKLPASWPWSNVGLHVPAGVHLVGSLRYDAAPTIINVDDTVTDLSAVVLIADQRAGGAGDLSDSGVSYVTVVGTNAPGRGAGQLCSSRGESLASILDLDGHEPWFMNFMETPMRDHRSTITLFVILITESILLAVMSMYGGT
jgi:hypothetical protein